MAPVTQSADSPVENTQWWSSWIILPKFSQHRTPQKWPFCNRITFRTLDLWGPGNPWHFTPPSDPKKIPFDSIQSPSKSWKSPENDHSIPWKHHEITIYHHEITSNHHQITIKSPSNHLENTMKTPWKHHKITIKTPFQGPFLPRLLFAPAPVPKPPLPESPDPNCTRQPSRPREAVPPAIFRWFYGGFWMFWWEKSLDQQKFRVFFDGNKSLDMFLLDGFFGCLPVVPDYWGAQLSRLKDLHNILSN